MSEDRENQQPKVVTRRTALKVGGLIGLGSVVGHKGSSQERREQEPGVRTPAIIVVIDKLIAEQDRIPGSNKILPKTEPASGARVALSKVTSERTMPGGEIIREAFPETIIEADDQGFAVFEDVKPGRYLVGLGNLEEAKRFTPEQLGQGAVWNPVEVNEGDSLVRGGVLVLKEDVLQAPSLQNPQKQA